MKKNQIIARYTKAKAQANGDKKGYDIRNQSGGVAHLYIYDEIDRYWGIDAQELIKDLSDVKSPVVLHLNTPGGNVFDGLAIYETLKAFPYPVEARIEGLAASIGSIIALGANRVTMGKASFFMIHRPWSIVAGDADAMLTEAALLEKIEGTLGDIYAGKTGREREELDGWMRVETWFTGEEALAAGFIDELFTMEIETEAARAAFDLSVFDNVPERLRLQTPGQMVEDKRARLVERRGSVYKALGWIE